MVKIVATWDISRCAAAPSKRSRTTARPMIIPAPTVVPCSARKNISIWTLVDRAQPTEAARKMASERRVRRLRP